MEIKLRYKIFGNNVPLELAKLDCNVVHKDDLQKL